MLTDELVSDVLAWREGDKSKGYPVTFVSSGIPRGFADWVVRNGGPAFDGPEMPHPQPASRALPLAHREAHGVYKPLYSRIP